MGHKKRKICQRREKQKIVYIYGCNRVLGLTLCGRNSADLKQRIYFFTRKDELLLLIAFASPRLITEEAERRRVG